MSPTLSVITAVRNGADLLPRLCESLQAQTLQEFDWIVQDGASTDATPSLLAAWREKGIRVDFRSEPDFGLYDALNRALRRSRSEYYLVLGADDRLEPEALAQYARAASTRPDIVLAHVRRDGRVIGGFRPERRWLGHAQVFRGSHSVGMLIRRTLHDELGYYSPRFPVLADGYFLKRVLSRPASRIQAEAFVAGEFDGGGVSSTNTLATLAETWQIQMLTEAHPVLQTALFGMKVLARLPRLVRQLGSASTS